jgi:phospholipid transport system substrate-binding protein
MPAIPRIVVWTLLLMAISLPCQALPPGEATRAIQGTIDKAREVLLDPRLREEAHRSERRERLRKALSERFDWTRFSQGVLGVHRRTLNAEQEKAFTALFRELLEATYMSRLDEVLEQVDEETLDAFRFVSEEIQGDRGVVTAEIDVLERGGVSMVYSVHRRGGKWMVYDVKVAGVSLVNNYRAQIDSILSRSDYDALMERLGKKVAELNRED